MEKTKKKDGTVKGRKRYDGKERDGGEWKGKGDIKGTEMQWESERK